jgi:hypothetical protein
MKKFLQIAFVTALAGFTSAKAQNTVNITDADLQGGQTYNWTKNNVYLLDGLVFLEDGGILNIEAGTVIKFTPRADLGNPSALVIARGARINALGTAAEPIIFTAEDDDVNDPTDLGPEDNALWGGVVLLGKAYTIKNGNTEVNVEGIPTTEPRGLYGMPAGQAINNDNSGTMRYCSLRHGGRLLSTGNELNGLTLAGVGSATTLEYIEVYANSDDGIEWFGGSVNCKYCVVAFAEDDSFDWDETWTGKGQFWFSIQRPDIADAGWECDGSTPDDVPPPSNPVVYNATHIGSGVGAAASNPVGWLLRAGTQGYIANSIVTDMKGKGIEVQDKPGNTTSDAYFQMQQGNLQIKNNLFHNIGTATQMNGTADGIIRITNNADDATAADLIAHLTSNNNQIANPQIQSISRTQNGLLDPRPSGTGAAYSTTLDSYPMGDAFFTSVNFKGAFSAEPTTAGFWVAGWTTLHKNNHLANVLSVQEFNGVIQSLNLFPNPANSNFNLVYTANKNVSVQIYGMNGQLIRTIDSLPLGTNQQTIDISTLSKGMYMIVFTDGNSNFTQKLIVE